jgi:hypothetical protein
VYAGEKFEYVPDVLRLCLVDSDQGKRLSAQGVTGIRDRDVFFYGNVLRCFRCSLLITVYLISPIRKVLIDTHIALGTRSNTTIRVDTIQYWAL